jgi:HAD superfamily hydrolase (TIGR01509 family)
VIIFDCNGVLVDSEPIAAAVAAQEFQKVGIRITPEIVARYFTGRRQSDMFADIEKATGIQLPRNFPAMVTVATLRRFHAELRATPHVEHALTWLRGPKCVASSSTADRIRVALDITGLIKFFDTNLFSASDVRAGKPAPDLFLHAANKMKVDPADCIVVEDSPAGVAAAHAAGMRTIGFIGGTHANPNLGPQLTAAGARTVVNDMRALKGAVVALRGW